MQSVSSRIWTRVAVSISYDDNHYITGTSRKNITERPEKELHGHEEGPKADIYLESFRTTVTKVPNREKPGHGGIYGFWF